jgi:hypothetical protein
LKQNKKRKIIFSFYYFGNAHQLAITITSVSSEIKSIHASEKAVALSCLVSKSGSAGTHISYLAVSFPLSVLLLAFELTFHVLSKAVEIS